MSPKVSLYSWFSLNIARLVEYAQSNDRTRFTKSSKAWLRYEENKHTE